MSCKQAILIVYGLRWIATKRQRWQNNFWSSLLQNLNKTKFTWKKANKLAKHEKVSSRVEFSKNYAQSSDHNLPPGILLTQNEKVGISQYNILCILQRFNFKFSVKGEKENNVQQEGEEEEKEKRGDTQ